MSDLEKAEQQAEPVTESVTSRPKERDYASFVGYTRALEAHCDALEQTESVVDAQIAGLLKEVAACEGKDPRGCWNVRCQLGNKCCRAEQLRRVQQQQAEPVVEPSFVISPTRMTWDDAMAWAAGLGMRLVTVEEMQEMSLQSANYWSGTEYSQSYAWYFNTFNGNQNVGVKCNALFAVAVAKRAEPVVVISPPAELKYVISPTRMTWDDAMAWAAGQGLRLATVAEMREWSLPADFYWSGTEYSQSGAWLFNAYNRGQDFGLKYGALFAVAVARTQPSVLRKEKK